jgi:hypothetical protein
MGDDVLTLRGPGDEVVIRKHRIAWSGPASVRTTCPIIINVDDEIQSRGATKKHAVVEGALEVAEDAFHNCEMGLMGVMHVEAHLLDRIGDVKPGEGEELESFV